MKNPIKYSLIAVLALFLVAGPIYAQVSSTPAPVTPPAEQVLTLTQKKAKADTDLRAIHAQLGLFTARTQIAIDRLSVKDIDTLTAQEKLTLSIASLDLAKTNLDLFSAVVVTNDADENQIAELKLMLKTIEDSLKEARANLIESLTTLKIAVSISIDTQVQ